MIHHSVKQQCNIKWHDWITECQTPASSQPSGPIASMILCCIAAPLQPWSWLTRPWSRLHLDFTGLFLGEMFLVLIDTRLKWIKVFVTSSSTSSMISGELKSTFDSFGYIRVSITERCGVFLNMWTAILCSSRFILSVIFPHNLTLHNTYFLIVLVLAFAVVYSHWHLFLWWTQF